MTSHPEFDKATPGSTVTSVFPDSVRNKTILITGVNAAGLGGATALALAQQGPKLLLLVGRTEAKANKVIEQIHAQNSSINCRFVQCDLSSQASVRKAAAEINALKEPIDIMINNAAVMAILQRELTEDGLEMQFGTNHVGHFLLTNLILPNLIAAAKNVAPSTVRIVNVSSFGHHFSALRFADLNFDKMPQDLPEEERPDTNRMAMMGIEADKESAYNPIAAYGNAKTANILYSLGLNKRLAKHGIASFAVHPGSIETELARHLDPDYLPSIRKKFEGIIFRKTLDQGTSTQLVAALDPALKADGVNVYLDDCQLKDAAPWARDEAAAERLWTVSEELVKEKFAFT